MPRAKPFKYTYEKEIVMYAYFRRLDYFSTECIYAPNAYRCDTITSPTWLMSRVGSGHARTLLKDIESIRPSAIIGLCASRCCARGTVQTSSAVARHCPSRRRSRSRSWVCAVL